MRRVLVAVAALTAALGVTGCQSGNDAGGTSAAASASDAQAGGVGAASAAAPGSAAPTGVPADAQDACDAVTKVSTDSGKAIEAALATFAAAKNKNDEAAIRAAEGKVHKALTDWAGQLAARTPTIAVPRIKDDVAELSTAITNLATQEEGVDVVAISDLRRQAEAVCD